MRISLDERLRRVSEDKRPGLGLRRSVQRRAGAAANSALRGLRREVVWLFFVTNHFEMGPMLRHFEKECYKKLSCNVSCEGNFYLPSGHFSL